MPAGAGRQSITSNVMNPIQIPSDGGKKINVLGIPMVIRIHGRDTGGVVKGIGILIIEFRHPEMILTAFRRLLQMCCPIAALLSPAVAIQAADYFPPPDSAGGWRAATNAAQARESAGMEDVNPTWSSTPFRYRPSSSDPTFLEFVP